MRSAHGGVSRCATLPCGGRGKVNTRWTQKENETLLTQETAKKFDPRERQFWKSAQAHTHTHTLDARAALDVVREKQA